MQDQFQEVASEKESILFISPLVYRPQKDNISKFFLLISRWYTGHIFALSGGRDRNVPIADFLFHSEAYESGALSRIYRGFRLQIILPFQLFWRKRSVGAVVAYDPYRSGLAALVVSRVLRCKLIVELNGDYHRVEPAQSGAKRFLMRLILRIVLRAASAIKVLNADQEAFCREVFPGKPVYRFPAFVATDYFESLDSFQGNYLLSIGHPFDLKGMDVLIAAFKSIAEKHRHTTLRIMGYRTEAEKLRYKELAQGHPRIEFIEPGWLEDVGEQMRGCYAFVNAARSEAMGRVNVEAMACAKPIAATRTNGAKECVVDGHSGLLCEIGDVTALALIMDKLLSNRERAALMGDAGRIRMHELFSEKACTDAYHSMFEEVIGESTVPQGII